MASPKMAQSNDGSTWITNATLPCSHTGPQAHVEILDGKIHAIHNDNIAFNTSSIDVRGSLLAPSLCHPHVHLDKAFLLSHPKYSHLQIKKGTFAEAMELTSKAKAKFEESDLLERGHRLVNESIDAGVTHMRAFVEVDPIVDLTCLTAGLNIKEAQEDQCHVQLCAFAQLPLFTAEDGGEKIRQLMTEAARPTYHADAVGSTPYVEADRTKMEQNVDWLIDLALEHDKHIDFHLDYNLDPDTQPLVWYVINSLKHKGWNKKSKKTIVLGHCTRLTLFGDEEWKRLKDEIGDLPISFVGLPTSDLYMMRTENGLRGTLPVPKLIKDYGINAAISMNNIGNAFTPQGCCDPLYLANLGVGVYQAGTVRDAELLYECVSTRAKQAIGLLDDSQSDRLDSVSNLRIDKGQRADMVLFNHVPSYLPANAARNSCWESRLRISDIVYFYDGSKNRKTFYNGRQVDPKHIVT